MAIFRPVLAICAAIYLLSQDNFTTHLALRLEMRLKPTDR